MRYLYSILVLILISSCKSDGPTEEEIAYLDQKIPLKNKIAYVFEHDLFDEIHVSDSLKEDLNSLYKAHQFKAFWHSDSSQNERGIALEQALENSLAYGIPKKRLHSFKKTNKLYNNELNYTISILYLINDLQNGFIDTLNKTMSSPNFISSEQFNFFQQKINIKNAFEDIKHYLIYINESDTLYTKHAQAHYQFYSSTKLDDKNWHVPTQKEDSLNAFVYAKKSLLGKGFIADSTINEKEFKSKLALFQEMNGLKPDSVIGKHTTDALNETNIEKLYRSSVVLDKLRKRYKSETYIEVNIPEYMLRLTYEDTLKSEHRIIVGKYETKTPIFSANLSTIISLPYWSVPYSITSKEFLPEAKRNVNYFAKHQMKIFDKNKNEVDPTKVNWSKIPKNTFPYKVVQEPGKHNSLGIIKFNFNNPYGVYFHDTPQKSLFKTYVRSYSHGCMRCENPVDLAKIILLKDKNKIIADSLDSLLVRKTHQSIKLNKRIPIEVTYRSVIVKNEGLLFMRDIYMHDTKLAKKLFG